MQRTLLLFLSVLLAFSGCKKPAGQSGTLQTTEAKTAACPNFFYYYNQEKIALTPEPEYLLVGFSAALTTDQKRRILQRIPGFIGFQNEGQPESAEYNMVKLKPETTCATALETIKKLEQEDVVLYANPVFQAPTSLGSGHRWVSITSEFVVTLRNEQAEAELMEQLNQTNTKLSENLGNNTYLLTATKNSRGNALEMANYFHELPFVLTSEPNFYLAGLSAEIPKRWPKG